MPIPMTKGHCYLCGEVVTQSEFVRHFSEAHSCTEPNAQECVLLKVEASMDPAYWLYLDISLTSSLSSLDRFLRKIWLECCGHMSEFSLEDGTELSKSTKLGALPVGGTLDYVYDFGSSTELSITLLQLHHRPKQRNAVRLLCRNIAPKFSCGDCGEDAEFVCCECSAVGEYPYFCQTCMQKGEHEYVLPIVNSPRMGVCAYAGEFDIYEFSED